MIEKETDLKTIGLIIKVGGLVNKLIKQDEVKKYFKKTLESTSRKLDEKYENQLFGGDTYHFLQNYLEELIEHFEPYGHLVDIKDRISSGIDFDTLPDDFYDSFRNILVEEINEYRKLKPILREYLKTSQIDQINENTREVLDKVNALLKLDVENVLLPQKTEYPFEDRYFITRKLNSTQLDSIEGPKEYSLSELIDLQKENRIVVLGFAGNGKSLELEKLRSELSNEESIYFPIAIDLGNNNFKLEGIQGYFTKNFPRWDQLNKELVVIIDGLDEVNENDIDDIRKQIQDLSKLKEKAIIIVSCRNNSYLIEEQSMNGSLVGFSSFYLPPFDDLQVYEYVSKRIEIKKNRESFFRELNKIGFKDDQFTPFYLVSLVDYFLENNRSLPSSKIELFEYLIDRKKNSEKAKSFIRGSQISSMESDLDDTIEKTAFVFQCTDRNYFSNKELSKIIKNEKLLQIIKYCYVLDNGGKGKWCFDHNNLKEYLSAKFLASRDFKFIQDTLFVEEINKIKPRWLNTLGFTISILSEKHEVYNSLVEHLKLNDPESLVRIEKDKIMLSIREELFLEIFENYVEKGRYPHSPKFSTEDLGYFVSDSKNICEYLIKQIDAYSSKVRIDLGLYLLVRNDHWQIHRAQIEDLITSILFNSNVSMVIKTHCLSGLRWFGIADEELTDRLFNEIDFSNTDIKQAIYYYIRDSKFLERHFSFIWEHYTESNQYLGDFKYTILPKIEKPSSFTQIIKGLRSGDTSRRHDEFSIFENTIKRLTKNKIYSNELNDEIYLFFKSKSLPVGKEPGLIDLLISYLDVFDKKNMFIDRLLNEYFEQNDENALFGLVHLLDHNVVKTLLSKIREKNTPLNQLRVMRNVLSGSKNESAFNEFFYELNAFTNEQLLWSEEKRFTEREKYLEQIKFLSNQKYFKEYIEFIYSSLEIEKLTSHELYKDFKNDWFDPKVNAFRSLMNNIENDYCLSKNELYEKIYDANDFFKVYSLWKIINSDYEDIIGVKENSFLKEWARNHAAHEFLNQTFERDKNGIWFVSNVGLFAGFFCQYYKLELTKDVYRNLTKIDCSRIPYIVNRSNEEWYFNKPLEDSELMTYILENLGEKEVKNEIVLNLKNENLHEEVIHHHLRFLRKRECTENSDLFINNDLKKYQLVSLVWFVDLGGDLRTAIDKLKDIDWREGWALIDAIIRRDKEILVPFLQEELQRTDDREHEIALITNLLECENEIGLSQMKNWVLKNRQFPGKTWAELAVKVNSTNRIKVIKDIYADSIRRNYGGNRSFHDRQSYLTVLTNLGKQDELSYKEVSKFLTELVENNSDQIFLHEAISNFEYDYYKSRTHSINLDQVLNMLIS